MVIPEGFQHDRILKNYSTFGIGGPAKYFLEIKQIAEMQKVISYCNEHKLPYFILGKGSNTLFDDRGFDGLVIVNKIDFLQKEDNNCWHVGAGYSFSLLGSQTARQGLSGLEFASGIPGSVGGAVYMNAGANGKETCESLIEIDYITPQGDLILLKQSDLEFRYRFSSFQTMRGAIVGARFQLTPCESAREKQLKIIDYRKKTQPYNAKSAGCVFRNPHCGAAGALIDQSHLKGTSIGGAEVSSIHANFVINTGNASAKDVLELIHLITKTVHDKTGIELESEVRVIPYDLAFVESKGKVN
jgi:UDP-N-acetylmuramate dehydrogenase